VVADVVGEQHLVHFETYTVGDDVKMPDQLLSFFDNSLQRENAELAEAYQMLYDDYTKVTN